MGFSWLFLLFMSGAGASAESPFRHLATTETGDRLYFVSERAIRGTNQPRHDKVFSWDAENGVRVVAAVERSGDALRNTNPYLLFHVSASADGARVAVGALQQRQMSCLGCSISYLTSSNMWPGDSNKQPYNGTVSLSGSGEWALILPRFSDPADYGGIAKLASGEFRPVAIGRDEIGFERRCPCGGRSIANDGSAVYLDGAKKLRLTGPAGDRLVYESDVPVFTQVAKPIITDDGGRIAFQTRTPAQMVIEDVRSGSRVIVASATPAGFSTDGNRILYIRQAQLYLMDLASGEERRLTEEPSGVVDAALAGNAQTAFYTTSAGNIFRVSVDSAESEGIVSAPLNLGLGGNAIGSSYRVLSQVTEIPTGLRLRIGGRALDLYAVPSGGGWELWAQIPEELAEGSHAVEWEVPEALLWDPRIETTEIALRRFSPSFVPTASGCSADGSEALIYHGSSEARVSMETPAAPGERIRAMMSGLGSSLSGLGPIECRAVETLYDFGYPSVVTPVDVPGVFLSPRFAGLYEVALQLPETLQGGFRLECTVGGQSVRADVAVTKGAGGGMPTACVSTSAETLGAPR